LAKEKSVAWKIVERITEKMKEQEEKEKALYEKEPALAHFIGEIKQIMSEETYRYFKKHPA